MTDDKLALTNQQQPTIMQLISAAIDKGIDADTMEKMLAMAERLDANRAKREYDAAMAKFQSECPVIYKDKAVIDEKRGGKTRYSYAPLDSIIRQTKGLIAANGFSYTFDTETEGSEVLRTCRVTHIGGHSEVGRFKVGIDPQAYMSQPQKFGSASTFASRYAFLGVFGIMTSDEDDDAQGDPTGPVRQQYSVERVVVKDDTSETHLLCPNEILVITDVFPATHLPYEAPFLVAADVDTNVTLGVGRVRGRDVAKYEARNVEQVKE